MRIAVFHNLPSGGAKRVLRDQVAGLAGLGHAVDVFIPATAEERFLPLADVASSIRVFPHAAPPARERMLTGRPAPLDPVRWLAFLRSMRALEHEIARAIDAARYDVVLVHPSQFTQAPFVLTALRTPAVYYCHEPLRAAYEAGITPPFRQWLIRQTLGRVDRRAVRSAAAVATNSRFCAEAIRTIYDARAAVLYPGVDTSRFRPIDTPTADYVLTVGALHPLKGLDFLIDALALVPAGERPPLRIVSDRSRLAERTRLEARAAAAGVQVEFTFRVSEEELVALYNGARAVLYAPHHEPLGLVPLEAMACGRPVLAVGEGGIPETVIHGRTGFVEDRDATRFAARLRWILDHPAEAGEMGRCAADSVRREWTWDRSLAALEALCREAVTSRRPAEAVGSA